MKLYEIIRIKEYYYRTFLFIILLIAYFYDFNVTIALTISILISYVTYPLTIKLNNRYGIPIIFITLLYAAIFLLIIFFLSKLIVMSLISQNSKLINLINNKEFISNKINALHSFIEHFSAKILHFGNGTDSQVYIEKINTLFNNLPDIIINKAVLFLRPIVAKSYITGLKLFKVYFILLLSLVFTCYLISDFEKIKMIPEIIFGRYKDKVLLYMIKIKNIVITIWINQIKVALILVVLYSIALRLFDFEYFFIYALCFSFFTMIPFVGALMSISLMIISCYMFDYNFSYSIKLLAVLMIGFSLENFFLTPKLVGNSINSHPITILIGLIILPQIFGIIGLLFTLPIVAILNSVILYN
jgi:predicted PurR-regulated permease PerM